MLAKLFENLAGDWALERDISTGERFSGKASFSAINSKQFRLAETGELRLTDGSRVNAGRSWVWELSAPLEIVIYYDETPLREYHRLGLVEKQDVWSGTAEHLCGDDRYTGFYEISGTGIFSRQSVKGPAKAYTVESRFKRS